MRNLLYFIRIDALGCFSCVCVFMKYENKSLLAFTCMSFHESKKEKFNQENM